MFFSEFYISLGSLDRAKVKFEILDGEYFWEVKTFRELRLHWNYRLDHDFQISTGKVIVYLPRFAVDFSMKPTVNKETGRLGVTIGKLFAESEKMKI